MVGGLYDEGGCDVRGFRSGDECEVAIGVGVTAVDARGERNEKTLGERSAMVHASMKWTYA